MKSKVLRIIDANTNRAVEGLRVMEEVARFVLENKTLTSKLKKMRNLLRKSAQKINPLQSRKALKDVGRKSYTKSEKRRKSILDIFSANAKRVQEALRVLEEFSKLSDPNLGRIYKDIRFRLYEIEKRALKMLKKQPGLDAAG
jgi:thiamine-phosphate pyrophosphorylase